MTENDHINELFDHSGCLRQSAIVRYIDGKLDEKELQAVLNHLDTCPLCRDATEGISGIGTDRFIEDMQQIRTDFFAKSQGNDRKHRLRLVVAVSAAASIVIILGLFFFYQQTRLNMKSNIAQSVDAGKEIKEKAKTFEESAPLDESVRPARSEKKESPIAGARSTEEKRIVKSVPKETQPVIETIEDNMVVADVIQDTFITEAEYSDFQEMSDDKTEEISVAYAEPQSVKVDMPYGAEMPAGKRSKSAINTGLIQEKAKAETVMTLPAGHDILSTDKRFTFKGGGLNEFIDYIQDQFITKDRLLKTIRTDSILISFMIDTTGRPANIKILNQTDPETGRKILEIFKTSPDWLPGTDNGIMENKEYIIYINIPDD